MGPQIIEETERAILRVVSPYIRVAALTNDIGGSR
jgi:hypothetical protein